MQETYTLRFRLVSQASVDNQYPHRTIQRMHLHLSPRAPSVLWENPVLTLRLLYFNAMLQPYKPLDTSWQASVIIDLPHHQFCSTLILCPVADAVKRNYVYRQGVADAGFTNGEIDLRRRNIEVSGDTTKKVPVSWQHAVMLPVGDPIIG
ncbi:LOW QUALITY PROTEIN: hypothetical protein T265_13034 [Opisthorchis viverrini]|uniref:Uncharacterized protein n=1 Tax=Opisthorchis viverrini TaxID=6198 RepID=A0A075A6H4_OPIVI|nr:LOW QUALITY PROTEIN: hypothetical protein T265_13034 [Opisthorchis viverrini]KER31230.1 LOW QUALITY PROTEIN: hypothetical protein T265_13034 [Opisthorchis viverrini]